MKSHIILFFALLLAAFMLSCQQQESSPVSPEESFILDKKDGKPGGGDRDPAETFEVTITTVVDGDLVVWTDGPQIVQSAGKKNWLHVFDSGGNGTRGNPNYKNAKFNTAISFAPGNIDDCEENDCFDCVGDVLLFEQFNQGTRKVVFDFQVNYDIDENPEGFSFFLFRWKDEDGRIFSASTGGGDSAPKIIFTGSGDITDPTETRVFEISEGLVIVQEINKKKVILTSECPNEQTFVVTVAPVPVTP